MIKLLFRSITSFKPLDVVAGMSKELQLISHYGVLGLPSPSPTGHKVSLLDIKSAYRRALLQHHPDKSSCVFGAAANTASSKYSVDQILLAFKTLTDPASRLQYDQSLKSAPVSTLDAEQPRPGLESVDLDDMEFDTRDTTWNRGCRCGNERGFVVTEDDLEKHADLGEILTECRGCSLWLKVTYASADRDTLDNDD